MHNKQRLSWDRISERIILLMFIALTISLMTASLALGQVVIDEASFVIPSLITEDSDLNVSFTVSNGSGALSYAIYLDGDLLSAENTANIRMDYSSSGDHVLKLSVSDDISNASIEKGFHVEDVPMMVTIDSPAGTYDTNLVPIYVRVSTFADICRYRIDSSPWSGLEGAQHDFYKNVTIMAEGPHNITVSCSNPYDSVSAYSNLNIDALHLAIQSATYTIDDDNVVTLSVITSIPAACRYDSSDKPYDAMLYSLGSNSSLLHSASISGLYDGQYTYSVRCRSDETTSASAISFSVVTRPTAEISLSRSSPIKAGTYGVSVTSSAPMMRAPALYYTFDTDASPRYVTLEGAGSSWKGYLIIEENTPNKVGTFHYSGTDLYGVSGTVITKGEIFLVDTTKPKAPISVDAVPQQNGDIRLKWYYDDEDVQRYNIYRTTSGDPDYVDYYDSTTAKEFVDDDVIDGVTYNYRIAAVDDADNDGELSGVIQAKSVYLKKYNGDQSSDPGLQQPPIASQDQQTQVLDVSLMPKINQLIAEFNSYLVDIEAVKGEMDAIRDPNAIKIINILHLSEDVKTAEASVRSLIASAESLKSQALTASELDMKLNKLRMDAIKAKTLVAEDIIVDDQTAFDQVTDEGDVNDAVHEILGVNLTRSVMDGYVRNNTKMQDMIKVRTEVLIFKIKYLGKDDYDRYTLLKKTVTSSQELHNISIIETIPKSFESKASDMIFDIEGQDPPVIVEEDPVLRWDDADFTKKTLYYMIPSTAEMSSAKEAKTVVLYTPDFKVSQTIAGDEQERSGILGVTGLAGVDLGMIQVIKISPIQWAVLVGVGMIMGLSVYYVRLDGKEKKRAQQRLKEHHIITRENAAVRSAIMKNSQQSIDDPKGTGPSQVKGGIRTGASKDALKDFDMMLRLEQANTAINNFDYENARIICNECMKYYSKLSFKSPEEKKNAKMMMDHIIQKVTVYRLIYSSRKNISVKNYDLRADILAISKICNNLYSVLGKVDEDHIDSEKKFLDYVSNSKKYLESISS